MGVRAPFAAGEVKNDYIGGDIGQSVSCSPATQGPWPLQRQGKASPGASSISALAIVVLWLGSDGSIQRYEIKGVPPLKD